MSVISERLRQLRDRLGYNQDGIAASVGMNQVTWSGWERQPPRALEWLAKLSARYGVSADWLLGLVDDPEPKRISLPEGGSEILDMLGDLSDRGRSELLEVARAIAKNDQQWREYETALDMIEALGGGDFIEAINQQLSLRAAELGSMDAAIGELRARLEVEESTEQHEQ